MDENAVRAPAQGYQEQSIPLLRVDGKRKVNMKENQLESMAVRIGRASIAHEYRLVSLRECPLPESLAACDRAEQVAQYWRKHVTEHPVYNPEVECLVVLLLNTRRRAKGHVLVSTGTIDTVLLHPREVFRPALVGSAASIVVMHNHPSGDPTPSEADVRVTRDLIRAGQLLKIEVCDHVIIGAGESYCSLRELGYFF